MKPSDFQNGNYWRNVMTKVVFERNVNEWWLDALNSIVVFLDDGSIRKAKTLEGIIFTPGLSEIPSLIEKGSIKAIRSDMIVEILQKPDGLVKKVVFTGHGCSGFEAVQEIDQSETVKCLTDWNKFRLTGDKIPRKEDYKGIDLVFNLIRKFSKWTFMEMKEKKFFATYDEVLKEVLKIEEEIEVEFDEQGNALSAETKDFDFTIGKNHTGRWCVGKKEGRRI